MSRRFPKPESSEPVSFFNPTGSKAVVCAFAHVPSLIITGHESGKVALFDAKTGEEVQSNPRAHLDQVTDLQLSPDRSYFVTSSKDKTARVSILSRKIKERLTKRVIATRYPDVDGPQDVRDRNTSKQRGYLTRKTIRTCNITTSVSLPLIWP